MAPRSQSDLVRIGMEGFLLIDEYFGRKPSSSSSSNNNNNNKPKVFVKSCRYNYYQPLQESHYYQPQEPIKVVRLSNGSSSTYTTNNEAVVMMRNGAGTGYEKAAAPQKFH